MVAKLGETKMSLGCCAATCLCIGCNLAIPSPLSLWDFLRGWSCRLKECVEVGVWVVLLTGSFLGCDECETESETMGECVCRVEEGEDARGSSG